MLTHLARQYAEQPSLDETALRFLHARATSEKDTALLVALARRDDLPADVAQAVAGVSAAAVVTARLTRAGVSAAELDLAANDKRSTVQAAVAAARGLPESAYRSVAAKASSNAVHVCLVANDDVPVDVRVDSIAALESGLERRNLTFKMSSTYTEGVKEVLRLDPRALTFVHLSARTSLALMSDKDCPQELAAQMVDDLLDFLNAYDYTVLASNRSRQYSPEVAALSTHFRILSKAAEFTDMSEEKAEEIRQVAKLLDAHVSGRGAGFEHMLRQATRRRVPRTGDKQLLDVSAAISVSEDFTQRLRRVDTPNLTEEEYALLVRSGSFVLSPRLLHGYEGSIERAGSELTRVAQQPMRAAAVLSRAVFPQSAYMQLSEHAAEIASTLASLCQGDIAAAGAGAYEWATVGNKMALMHALHCLPAVIGLLPVKALPGLDAGDSYARCCDTGPEQLSLLVMEHLLTRLGSGAAEWRVFEQLASKLHASLDEAIDTTLASM